jgi:hypothetical protein
LGGFFAALPSPFAAAPAAADASVFFGAFSRT